MNETNAMSLANNAMGAVDWDALHARSRAIFDAVHRGSSLALQSGLYPTPPERPDMTRALPDYASRDPNELAMLRHREMVRPQAGRADFPIEHVANMASAAAAFSPAGAFLAPEFMAGRAVAAGAQYAPRLTTAALAGGAALTPSAAGGADDPEQVKLLQTKLRDAGFYVGPKAPIDGKMGPATIEAQKAFAADEAARKADDIKRMELSNAAGANTAALETARANSATAAAKLEADRLQAERDAALLARKAAGDQRMRDIEKTLPLSSRIMRDYSGPTGMVLGGLAGSVGRVLTQTKADRAIQETAAAANKTMGEDVALGKKGADAALARATRANQFWREGGASEVPFLLEPGKAPGFAINPKATPLNATYSPQIHPAVEAATAAPAAMEWGIANHYKGKWEEELKDAEKALSEDASEANIQRFNKARDNVGLFTGLERFGQTALGFQAVGGVGSRFMNKGPNMRPNMQPAEAEQGALQKFLREAADKAAKKAAAGKPLSVLEQRQLELGSAPTLPPSFTGRRATNGRQIQ